MIAAVGHIICPWLLNASVIRCFLPIFCCLLVSARLPLPSYNTRSTPATVLAAVAAVMLSSSSPAIKILTVGPTVFGTSSSNFGAGTSSQYYPHTFRAHLNTLPSLLPPFPAEGAKLRLPRATAYYATLSAMVLGISESAARFGSLRLIASNLLCTMRALRAASNELSVPSLAA